MKPLVGKGQPKPSGPVRQAARRMRTRAQEAGRNRTTGSREGAAAAKFR